MQNSGCESAVCCYCDQEPEIILPCEKCGAQQNTPDICDIANDHQCQSTSRCYPEGNLCCGTPTDDCCTTANTQNYDYLCPECAAKYDSKSAMPTREESNKAFSIESFTESPSGCYQTQNDLLQEQQCTKNKATYQETRKKWCKTPLTAYQATQGALALKILLKEVSIPAILGGPPPCNICEDILPLCRDYLCECCRQQGDNFDKKGSVVDRYRSPRLIIL